MIIDFLSLTICFIGSYFLSHAGLYLPSGIVLCAEGIFLCVRNLRYSEGFPNPISVFSLSWVFCIGISACKLSKLQTNWNPKTWICFYLIFVLFAIFYTITKKKLSFGNRLNIVSKELPPFDVLPVIVILTMISVLCFLTEACILGYIPLFTKDTPHAYSSFHISGLHYFTVLFVLEPSLFVYYLLMNTRTKKRDTICALCTIVCLILPLLLVSRFQLLFGIILALFTFFVIKGTEVFRYFNKKSILIALSGIILLICCYVFITIERAHSVEYLNGIFEMKDASVPIFITQPYIYIANNFDNFNCLVEELPKHTFGMKQLFPVFALSGLKFKFPELVNYPLYVTKEELTTVTLFYDAYYDFGIIGCALLSAFLGFLYALTEKVCNKVKSAGVSVITAQLYSYLFLAFFTTWFSNPTTWFYLIISIAIEFLLWYFNVYKKKKGTKSHE